MSEAPRPTTWKDLAKTQPAGARVLIVEDTADVRRVLERMVLGHGYEVRSAASAEDADRWISAERFDVMLLDVELPRMKGTDFLSGALERDGEMAVIMLSGLDDVALAVTCLERGARAYLVKPIEPDFLRIALRDAVAVRRLLVERNQKRS